MILKKLYEDYDLRIEPIILKEYKKLKLTMQEAAVLAVLFSMYKKRRTFSLGAVSRRIDYTQNEIGIIVSQLMEKGFMQIMLEQREGKEREVYSLEETLLKIEQLYEEEALEKQRQMQQSQVAETIQLFESGMGRILKSSELDTIRSWYDQGIHTHQDILKAIDQSFAKLSVRFVERLLNQKPIEVPEVDAETSEALKAFFKRIK